MIRHMFSNLMLLWLLSHELYTTGLAYPSEEQSWNNQNLSSVPLDLDVRLRSLDLSNNFIRQLHTLALPFLQQLDLSNNQLDLISEGAFENLARLERLNLSRNELNNNLGSNSKALQSLGALKSLDISGNGLSNGAAELYLKNKSSLDRLTITGNGLTRVSHSMFRESKSLRTVTIDSNLISEIEERTFEPLRQLETLSLANNILAHICDFKLHQVKFLNLSRNSIEFFVTREDDQLYNLEILDLSYNRLLYFPIVPKLNNLKHLHLQNNMIGALNSEATMVTEVNTLYGEIMKERMTKKNYLHSNWRPMPLIHINLSYNHFTSFPLETLSLLSSLESLDFSHNCLQEVKWNIRSSSDSEYVHQLYFHSLKQLDLQGNGLVNISPIFLKALTQIETLNLQDNSVQPCASDERFRSSRSSQQVHHNTSCVAFELLKTLKHLNLRENNIKELQRNTFQHTSLVSLNLAKNFHIVMHGRALEGVQASLQSLIISEINMTSSRLSLACLPALKKLDISNNHLVVMPSSLDCSPLRELDIRNNDFSTLNASLIHNLSAHLRTVYASGNHFNCCDTGWLKILNETEIKVPDIGETKCFASLENLVLTDYLRNPSMYCLRHVKTQDGSFGQICIVILFVAVLLTALIFFAKKLFGTQNSYVV